MFSDKKEKYTMDINTAGNMLGNVFVACGKEPNRVPFDTIVSRSRQSFFSDNLMIILCSVLLVLTFICPLFFPHGSIFMSAAYSKGRALSISSHSVENDRFTITLDGGAVDLGITYMENDMGEILYPISYDRADNTVVFPYNNEEYNIFIYDLNGRCLHLLLSPRN